MKGSVTFFDSYSDASGGAPKSMLTLASLLDELNYIVSIHTARKGSLYKKAQKNGLDTFSFDLDEILMVRRGKQNISIMFILNYFVSLARSWAKCFKYIRTIKNSKVCFNDIRCFLYFFPIAVFKRKDLIWYVRINDRVNFVTWFAGRISNKILLVSSSCRDMFTAKELESYSSKMCVVHTGFPVEKENDFIRLPKIKLGFIGVLSARKNIELLMNAVNLLDNPTLESIEVIVVGEAKLDEKDYEKNIKNKVHELGLNEVFKFVGHTTNVHEYYSQIDSVVLTSFSEGLPRVLIEGLSHGCFVITTNVDGVGDIITDDYLGIILNRYSDVELAKSITKYVFNRDKYLLSRGRRRRYVADNFSEEKFVNNFINSVW
ncbi:glycosyltransferase family 4 protein [Pseudoalteromonas sp. SCSIO 43088]|uniref:glycosyltransferase family 4 protein n=1 Tax=Pseudoalteromonas sp. SCSIO 43088 TaxID=2822846 RepID=UPI00202ADEFE|nr:glycosyltransferase family 4 protein [Pseudoalteromonas sp. SCSIO 43088]URQ86604.1 glycosyltransferase family 4 protein [Pseudoalteromonas sp. SCSIO 43088]